VASLYAIAQDTTYISSTVIDGNSEVLHVVSMTNGETSATKLIGFTITGGYADGDSTDTQRGGGIYLLGSSPTISHCRIVGNYATQCGGGMSWTSSYGSDFHIEHCVFENNVATGAAGGLHAICLDDEAEITDCVFRGNTAATGGGMYLLAEEYNILDCLFDNNIATESGGAVYAYLAGALFDSCIFNVNLAASGAAAVLNGNNLDTGTYTNTLGFVNCTFFANVASSAGGVVYGEKGANFVLANSILYGNQPQEIAFADTANTNTLAVAYCDVEGGEAGIVTNDNADIDWLDGNIDADPLFADPANGDYSLAVNSPCIDAGTAHFTYDGVTYVNLSSSDYYGNAPDIGAEEYNPNAVHEGTTPPAHSLNLRAYPNPFNPETTVAYSLAQAGHVRLCAYNVRGQRVATLVNAPMPAGEHTVQWAATGLPSGVYLLRLEAGGRTQTRKALLLK